MRNNADYLVIGSGLAGLTYALRMAHHGKVALLTKQTLSDANSSWAQGGIAGAMAKDDSFDLHIQDTLTAGAGLCKIEAVETLVKEGPERIRELINLGANFDLQSSDKGVKTLALGREGGHSRNRIVHTADHTGLECEITLLNAVLSNPNIVIYEHYFSTNLIIDLSETGGRKCVGAYALDTRSGENIEFIAKATMLATGGCGQVYTHSTNPTVATADGVAMAWRAGAPIANMEFIQFHPTTLYHPDARAFLISEALRGEGGILCHKDGDRFMERYHPLKDLAPRDIVARAIVNEMKLRNVPCVYLDATHIPIEELNSHFPTITERCGEVGIHIHSDLIPIAPAQHYQCGGVLTNLDGATNIPGLYAAGEAACTGVHGANRLASNSLLEALVFAHRAASHTIQTASSLSPMHKVNPIRASYNSGSLTLEEILQIKSEVQELMQKYSGIIRCNDDLSLARSKTQDALSILDGAEKSDRETWEALNITQTALIILDSALKRHESRGLHFSLDYPNSLESEKHDTVLVRS